MKKIMFILFEFFITLLILTSCDNDYANKMFEMYKDDPDRMIFFEADIIPLGKYGKCKVACFHEKHEDGWNGIGIPFYIFVGPYSIRKPCTQTVIEVYNRSTKEMLYINDAYKLGWINDDDLLHIFYEYDQALDQLTGHDWHKSENFIWDLERYKDK